MTNKELKELVITKLRGDNNEPLITALLLKEALFDVLRRTKPLSYIEKTLDTSVWFRKIDKDRHLRMPKSLSLDDFERLDIDEELAMAVVYFLSSYLANKEREYHKERALEIISTYDTNINLGDFNE